MILEVCRYRVRLIFGNAKDVAEPTTRGKFAVVRIARRIVRSRFGLKHCVSRIDFGGTDVCKPRTAVRLSWRKYCSIP